jgi:Ca2+-binding RTX toxin-like protein
LRPRPATPTAAHLTLCLLVAACAAEDPRSEYEPRDHEGVEEASEALEDLSAQCTFTPGTGIMELTLNAGDIALVSRSSIASSATVQVNGHECGPAAVTALRQLAVTEGNAGDETLILDYSNGPFAAGRAGEVGIDVDLGSETTADALKLVGSSAGESFVYGDTAIAINADAFPDIHAVSVELHVASMGAGNDTFSGAGSVATGAAFPLALEVFGGAGNDTLRGGAGNDVYSGGEGNDLLVGGAAADGADVMNGGGGSDTADYGGRAAAVTVSLDGVDNDGDSGGEGDNLAADIEIVKGGSGGDNLTGGAGSQTLHGGPGNDTLAGAADADVLNGEAGDDAFDEGTATSGADVLNGGLGTDTADYSGRTVAVRVVIDTLPGDGQSGENDKVSTDVENLTGGDGNDQLTGSTGVNLLAGGPGDDQLAGGDGDDLLRGGDGDDTLNGGNGRDTLDAEESAHGNDTMLGGTGVDMVTYAARSGAVAIVMDGSTQGGETGEGDRVGTDVEHLRGGPGDDQLTGNALDNLIEGAGGDDTIDGAAGDDTIDGDAGNDVIVCGAGDGDVLLDTTVASADGCEL